MMLEYTKSEQYLGAYSSKDLMRRMKTVTSKKEECKREGMLRQPLCDLSLSLPHGHVKAVSGRAMCFRLARELVSALHQTKD